MSSVASASSSALASSAETGSDPASMQPAPIDFLSPQLTWKSIVTGMILGGLLSICNIYTGLKIGWGLNMSITGILLGFAFWLTLSKITAGLVGPLGKLENNVSQSAISAGGAVSSAGLVSAIPAVEMLDGPRLAWWQLVLWITTVCLVGIAVAMGLRRQMIIRDKLPFPGGLACAATIRDVYARGEEAMRRVAMLGAGAIAGGIFKLLEILKVTKSATFGASISGVPASTYSFALDPTLLMGAVGGLVGFRACWSIMLGAIIAWGIIATRAVDAGLMNENRGDIGKWLLWPGVALMVVSSLVSFSFSIPGIVRGLKPKASGGGTASTETTDTGEVPRRIFFLSVLVALVLGVFMQAWFYGISWWAAAIAVLLSFALAVVACRVSGETNVTPVGAMGKVTQFTFAGLMPSNTTANLMSAGVTAGAASQCADLMHDLKCGYLLGGVARKQVVAQILGAFSGAVVASAFYLVLVKDAKTMLGTPEWPAVAVIQWKAVAEVFKDGIDSLPKGASTAMLIAACVGVALPIMERLLPKAKTFIPSAASLGLAFVIPASNSISMFLGGCVALILTKSFPKWSDRFLVTICAGIIAGESLTGAGDAIYLVLKGTG